MELILTSLLCGRLQRMHKEKAGSPALPTLPKAHFQLPHYTVAGRVGFGKSLGLASSFSINPKRPRETCSTSAPVMLQKQTATRPWLEGQRSSPQAALPMQGHLQTRTSSGSSPPCQASDQGRQPPTLPTQPHSQLIPVSSPGQLSAPHPAPGKLRSRHPSSAGLPKADK